VFAKEDLFVSEVNFKMLVEELETNLMSLVIFITLNICSTCSKHVEQILSVINITSDIKLVSNSSTITMMHGNYKHSIQIVTFKFTSFLLLSDYFRT